MASFKWAWSIIILPLSAPPYYEIVNLLSERLELEELLDQTLDELVVLVFSLIYSLSLWASRQSEAFHLHRNDCGMKKNIKKRSGSSRFENSIQAFLHVYWAFLNVKCFPVRSRITENIHSTSSVVPERGFSVFRPIATFSRLFHSTLSIPVTRA